MSTVQLNITLPDGVQVLDIINALRDAGIKEISTQEERDFIPIDEAMADIFPDMTPDEIAGGLLRTARKNKHLTQEQLAKLVASQKVAISEMEKGKRPISKVMAKKLAKALDVHYTSFL